MTGCYRCRTRPISASTPTTRPIAPASSRSSTCRKLASSPVPGQGTPAIQSALISHCENALYRFAILDPQYPDAAIADIQAQRQQFDTKFAAIYYPTLTVTRSKCG
jgi:hypothetical protein